MSTWKVILATLVIFVAGLFTGTALLRVIGPGPGPAPGRPPMEGQMREEYVRRLAQDLKLTPAQVETVRKIMTQSQQQMRQIFEKVHNDIRSALTPDQQRLFDDMRRRRPERPEPGSGPGPMDRRNRFRGPPSDFESNRPPIPPPPPDEEMPPPPKP